MGAGFLCFPVFFSSLHTHPLAPFPLLGHVSLYGYLVVSFCLIFCLFVVLFLVIVLTVVVYSVRSMTHFKCRRHYPFTLFCVGFFFSFCCLSLFLFLLFLHTNTRCSQPPPHTEMGTGDILARRLRKRYPGGRFGLSRLTKTKIKNTLALRKVTAGFQKNNKNTQALRTTKQPPPAGHFTQGFGCQGHLLGVFRRKPNKNKKCFPGQSYSAWWVFPLLTHPWPL